MDKQDNTKSVVITVRKKFPKCLIDDDNADLSYWVAWDFGHYLLECYKKDDFEELQNGLYFIETLVVDMDKEIQELAVIWYLEGIQNIWWNNDVDPEIIYDRLGKESKKWRNQLNKFWNKEIRYVGETINDE